MIKKYAEIAIVAIVAVVLAKQALKMVAPTKTWL